MTHQRWAQPSPWTPAERRARQACYKAFATNYPHATPAEIGKMVDQHWKDHMKEA